jgi:DNA (cytosine-5)-methyltransferase 1
MDKFWLTPSCTQIDLICGGFPCQPFCSVAGKQRGDQDDRHLWPEYFRLIQEIRPRWVIGENVAGLINLGLDQVLSDLESEGYSCQTLNIPACAVNAPHRRDRLWIVANSRHRTGGGGERGIVGGNGTGEFQEGIGTHEAIKVARPGEAPEIMAYSNKQGVLPHPGGNGREQGTNGQSVKADPERSPEPEQEREGRGASTTDPDIQGLQGGLQDGVSDQKGREESGDGCPAKRSDRGGGGGEGQREAQPCMGGVVDGVPTGVDGHFDREPDIPRVEVGVKSRIDRLKQLGNSVVPQVVEQIGRAIMQIERENNGI